MLKKPTLESHDNALWYSSSHWSEKGKENKLEKKINGKVYYGKFALSWKLPIFATTAVLPFLSSTLSQTRKILIFTEVQKATKWLEAFILPREIRLFSLFRTFLGLNVVLSAAVFLLQEKRLTTKIYQGSCWCKMMPFAFVVAPLATLRTQSRPLILQLAGPGGEWDTVPCKIARLGEDCKQ